MAKITNAPSATLTLDLERRKSFAFRLNVKNADGGAVDLTGARIRFVLKPAAFDDDHYDVTNIVVNQDGSIPPNEGAKGYCVFGFQAAELDQPPGEYYGSIVMWTSTGYSVTLLKLVVNILENTESDSMHVSYVASAPPTEIEVALRGNQVVNIYTQNLGVEAVQRGPCIRTTEAEINPALGATTQLAIAQVVPQAYPTGGLVELRPGDLVFQAGTGLAGKVFSVGDVNFQMTTILAPEAVAEGVVAASVPGMLDEALEPVSEVLEGRLSEESLSSTYVSKVLDSRRLTQAFRAPALARVLDKFLTGGGGIMLGRVGTTYSFYRALAAGLYLRTDLVEDSAEPGGFTLKQLRGVSAVAAMLSKPYGDASVASSGTWTTGTNVAAYNGGYVYSTAAGASKTFTTPAGVTSVGLRVPKITNGGGWYKVTIDGDATLADALPTAQEAVNLGMLLSTVLVANGGTLNPTDRVFDTYAPTTATNDYDAKVGLAANLAPGVHTVVVTNTGYMRGSSTGQRCYLAGFTYGTATSRPGDASSVIVPVAVLNSGLNSAWEHAEKFQPTGAATAAFVGNVHGWEAQDSFSIRVDDADTTLTDGQIVAANRSVQITRVSHFVNHENPTVTTANVEVIYTLGRFGLDIEDTITWAVPGTVSAAYAMLPMEGAASNVGGVVRFTRGGLLDCPAGPVTMVGASETDVYLGASKSAAAWMWGGKFGALLSMPAIEDYTEDWVRSAPHTSIEDRNLAASGRLSKIYMARTWSQAEAVVAGTVHHYKSRVTVGYFPSGAEASLASL